MRNTIASAAPLRATCVVALTFLAEWAAIGQTTVVLVSPRVARDGEPMSFNEQTRNVLPDYNLCMPKSNRDGPHRVSGDPVFVDAGKGMLWLRPESPARGKGSSEHAPDTDFWGRTRAKDQPPDLGAMPFVADLTRPEGRSRFEGGWTYHRHGSGGTTPGFWALPRNQQL